MRFTVVGAGGVGGVFGAYLQSNGHSVTFVESRQDHVAAMRSAGLSVTGAAQFKVWPRVLLPDEVQGALHAVLLAVKAPDTQGALDMLSPHLSSRGYVVALQNGLEAEKVAAAVGGARTIGAELTLGAYYSDPGHVVLSGRGSMAIGEVEGESTPRVERLGGALTSLLPVSVSRNIVGVLWSKMAIGAMWFATALVDEDVPTIFQRLDYQPVLRQLAVEVVRVGRRHDVVCEPLSGLDVATFAGDGASSSDVAKGWEVLVGTWRGYEFKRTGVWRDIAIWHRATEVPWILGAVIDRGLAVRADTPLLVQVRTLIAELEEGSRTVGWHNLDELKDCYRLSIEEGKKSNA